MLSENQDINSKARKIPAICYVVGVCLVLYLFVAALVIIIVYLDTIKTLSKDIFFRAHVYCGAFGMMGAAIASIRKYYQYIITHFSEINTGRVQSPMEWCLGWVYYYLTRPILGSILGAMTYLLSFVGLQILADSPSVAISGEGKFLLFALSFLAGFSVSDVLDKIGDISKQVFRSKKDTIPKEN